MAGKKKRKPTKKKSDVMAFTPQGTAAKSVKCTPKSKVDKKVAEDYWARYYSAHKEEIAVKRKDRYHRDPEYRRTVLEHSAKRYEKLRQQRLEERASNPQPPRVRGHNRPITKVIDGEELTLHSISEFASRADRNVQTITTWEQKGVIPKATHIDHLGRRWYSEHHMNTIAALSFEFRARGGRRLADFKALVDEAFASA
jgi:hypothetical protein